MNEFIKLKDIKVRDNEHLRVIEYFYLYLRSVTDDECLLPSVLEKLLGIDLSDVSVVTACFNGVNDGCQPPYDNIDLYIKLSNDIKVFVYSKKQKHLAELKKNEYVIFLLSESLSNDVTHIKNNHIIVDMNSNL